MSRGGIKAEEKGWLGYCKVSCLFIFQQNYFAIEIIFVLI